MAGKFQLKRSKNDQFMFHLKASNGQIILSSQFYKSKAGAQNGIKSVMKNAQDDNCFERKESKSSEPYFVLKAANKQVIGKSEMYSSVAAMEKGIASVKKNAPDAAIDDQTEE
jgi:hypothetical protein